MLYYCILYTVAGCFIDVPMILCNIKIDITNHILVYLNYFLVSWSVGFSIRCLAIRCLAIRCLSCTLYSLLTVTMTGGDANICTQWNMNPIEKSRCYAKSLTILLTVCVYGWHSHAIWAKFTVCVYLQELFRFGGVYCGAVATIPFTVTNKVRGL